MIFRVKSQEGDANRELLLRELAKGRQEEDEKVRTGRRERDNMEKYYRE